MKKEEKRAVRPGEIYRYFKGGLYQIVTTAAHWETQEAMVVYQQLYDDFRVYVRPYDLFAAPVDREKHPEAEQKYKFELVREIRGAKQADEECGGEEPKETGTEEKEPEPNQALLRFLAAETGKERMACLKELALTASQKDLDSVYLVLDMKHESGTIEEQVNAISRNLALQQRYDGIRLR